MQCTLPFYGIGEMTMSFNEQDRMDWTLHMIRVYTAQRLLEEFPSRVGTNKIFKCC